MLENGEQFFDMLRSAYASLFFRVRYTPYPQVFGVGAVALVGEMFRFDGFSRILSLILRPLADLHYELTNLDGHLR